MNNIGGIETALWQVAKAFKDADITFLVNSIADGAKIALERLKTLHNVVFDDDMTKVYEVDVALIFTPIMLNVPMDHIKAGKIYQFVHSDIGALMETDGWKDYKWKPDSSVSKVIAVSSTVQKALKEKLGVDSVVVPNIFTGTDQRRVFLFMSRATSEKGLDRLLKMADEFDKAGKDYLIIIASRVDPYGPLWPAIESNPRIVYIESSIYNDSLYRCADYLVQLSDMESYCYSIREALYNGVAVLGTGIPEIKKIITDGKNGYILEKDLSNLDVDKIFNKVPKVKPGYTEPIDDKWLDIMEGKL